MSKDSDIAVLTGDFIVQFGTLNESENCLNELCASPPQRTDNVNKLLKFCTNNRLFPFSMSYQHSLHYAMTWLPNSIGNLSQIGV